MAIELRGVCPLLQVFDMNASLAFWRDALGFEVVGASPVVDTPEGRFSHWMHLRHGTAEVMLNTAYDEGERPARPDPARVAAHGDAGLFFGCPDVDAAWETLRARGVECDPPQVAPYGMKQLNLHDPDGYPLCFQWPA